MCILGEKHRKRLMAALLCLLFILCDFIPAKASDVNVSDGISNERVKAGIFYFDGYHMKDEEGRLSGYGVELLQMISKYSHLNFD